jgi:excinuclease ABC subunit A
MPPEDATGAEALPAGTTAMSASRSEPRGTSNAPTRAVGRRSITLTLADFYRLPIRRAVEFVSDLAGQFAARSNAPLALALAEVGSRLGYLDQVGLGYLTLDRPTRSLSGGETERVNLASCLGTRLVNTLFVLDEPSVGLHPRDTERLVRILEQLRRAGNTVVVVEHEPSVMRAADRIVDLGPGQGAGGGEVVFEGRYQELLESERSLTGQYLSGRKQIAIPRRRPVQEARAALHTDTPSARRQRMDSLVLHDSPTPLAPLSGACPFLRLRHATRHNLRDVSVDIPLRRFVCVTGVSGSGKTTLVREVLLPLLFRALGSEPGQSKASDRLSTGSGVEAHEEEADSFDDSGVLEGGAPGLDRVILVDQASLAKTPRSNPALYIGAFDAIRELFAQSEPARQRGFNAVAFSFNSGQGRCERCSGSGFEKIEMQFLSDVFIRCPDCNGRRYRAHILEIKLSPGKPALALSIGDLLERTTDEAILFLSGFLPAPEARRALDRLEWLRRMGLGYLKLGQPLNTLSGGESQRLKLVGELASLKPPQTGPGRARPGDTDAPSSTLFLFDEPTTGLHFQDVEGLIGVFQTLVDAGHSLLVVEHNLELIKSADWIIDLGPEAGDLGGNIVAEGTPEHIAACPQSHTGMALQAVLETRRRPPHEIPPAARRTKSP